MKGDKIIVKMKMPETEWEGDGSTTPFPYTIDKFVRRPPLVCQDETWRLDVEDPQRVCPPMRERLAQAMANLLYEEIVLKSGIFIDIHPRPTRKGKNE